LSGLTGLWRLVEAFGLLGHCGCCGRIDFAFESICISGHGGGLQTKIGSLCNWVIDVRDECQVLLDVVLKHGQEIVIKPLSSFLEVSFGCYQQEFAHITHRFDGVAPGHVKDNVVDGFLGSQVVCINFQIECSCGASDHRDHCCKCEILIILHMSATYASLLMVLTSPAGIKFSTGLLSVCFLVI